MIGGHLADLRDLRARLRRLLEVYRAIAATAQAASDPGPEAATALHRAYHVAAAATVRVAAEHVRAHPEWYAYVS